MPHIHATLPFNAFAEREALKVHKEDIVRILAEFSPYKPDDILLEAKILTREEVELSVNLVPLVFIIDLGTCPEISVDDVYAGMVRGALLRRCSRLRLIHFILWIKRHPDNGVAEHKIGRAHV